MSGCFDYRVSRRSMLGASTGLFLGLGVKQLVARAGTDHKASAEHVILFWNGGGMSHIDTFDPKPGRPTQGEFNPIDTTVPGMQVSEIFPQLAKQAKHFSLIRSIAGTNGDHGRGTYQLQTSYNVFPNLTHPGLGNIVTNELEQIGDLPSFVSISGQGTRAGYLGQKCEAFYVGRPGEKDPYLAFPEGITNLRGNKRLEALAKINSRFTSSAQAEQFDATSTATQDAVRLMRSPALEAFELQNESAETRERYGVNEFGRGCLLARRLVEKGVRFVQVNRGGFDVHMNAFPAMENHGEIMDPALAALISDLAASGLLAKTLIITLSEFGRTPKINKDAGRDHHASVFSALIAGGGIKGGTVIGSSDEDGYKPKDRPVEVPDIHATVCHALGINPAKEVATPLQRPLKLVDGGTPVAELFA
ncbi:MAG: DUF1501 domain-containing protein [Planctomycetaceae bacterium]|nr:DUF1501 domain-containing protein [Planctomycetaceae bacterium]